MQTAALNFNTPADNWNMAIVAVGSLPTTDTFTVMRWGGTNRVAYTDPADVTKLVLPIDLSKSSKCGAAQNSQCGNGKYVVKQVKAFPWSNGGSYVSTGAAVALATPRTAFTFVGELVWAGWTWCVPMSTMCRSCLPKSRPAACLHGPGQLTPVPVLLLCSAFWRHPPSAVSQHGCRQPRKAYPSCGCER